MAGLVSRAKRDGLIAICVASHFCVGAAGLVLLSTAAGFIPAVRHIGRTWSELTPWTEAMNMPWPALFCCAMKLDQPRPPNRLRSVAIDGGQSVCLARDAGFTNGALKAGARSGESAAINQFGARLQIRRHCEKFSGDQFSAAANSLQKRGRMGMFSGFDKPLRSSSIPAKSAESTDQRACGAESRVWMP